MSDVVLPVLAAATVVCVVANAFIVVADLIHAEPVLANSAEVGLRPTALPYLAGLEGAGAVGLVAGFAELAAIGLAL